MSITHPSQMHENLLQKSYILQKQKQSLANVMKSVYNQSQFRLREVNQYGYADKNENEKKVLSNSLQYDQPLFDDKNYEGQENYVQANYHYGKDSKYENLIKNKKITSEVIYSEQQLEQFQPQPSPQYQTQQTQLQMFVQIDSNNIIPLKLTLTSDPMLLAKQFIYRHNLDPRIITLLSKQIKQVQNRNNTPLNRSQVKSVKQSRVEAVIGYSNNSRSRVNSSCIVGNQQEQYENQKENFRNNANNGAYYQNQRTQGKGKEQDGYYSTQNQSKNNTTFITNASRTRGQVDVFQRLYRHSMQRTDKQKAQKQKNKKKLQQSQYQLRNPKNQFSLIQNTLQKTTLPQQHSLANESQICYYKQITPNYQLKIYQKNTKLKKQCFNRNQALKQHLSKQQQIQCKAQPEINPLSKLIVNRLRSQQINYSSADNNGNNNEEDGVYKLEDSHLRLYQQRERSKEKKIVKTIQHLKQKQQKQMEQCTFHPKILKKSQQQKIDTQRYLLLHQDFQLRKVRAQTTKAADAKKIKQMHQPTINKLSRKITQGREFAERMLEYKLNAEKNKARLQKQRQSIEKHHPEINKSSKNLKRSNLSVGQYLYSKSQQKKKPISQFLKQNQKTKFLNQTSETMYEQMKKHSFRYIFTLMDSDEDGLISALKINILGLPTQALQLIAPLLCEMQQGKVELDEQQFVDSINRLFNTFNISQKNLILNIYKNPLRKSKTTNELSFHPSLNQKSIELAKQTRETGRCLYQMSKQKQKEKENRLYQIRALQSMLQMEECTFQPNVYYFGQKYC